MPEFVPYQSEMEIAEVVQKFENCEYRRDEFPHFRHLAVAAWYLTHMPFPASLERIREKLLAFTQHHGVNAYHETITQFWLRLVFDFLKHAPANASLPERVNTMVQQFGRKDVLFDYYSHDCVTSDKARAGWVPPDLKALPDSPLDQRPSAPFE